MLDPITQALLALVLAGVCALRALAVRAYRAIAALPYPRWIPPRVRTPERAARAARAHAAYLAALPPLDAYLPRAGRAPGSILSQDLLATLTEVPTRYPLALGASLGTLKLPSLSYVANPYASRSLDVFR